MDPVNQLLDLRQGELSIEDYIHQFCELSFLVPSDEVILKDIFRFGLNEPLKSWFPEGTLNSTLRDFMDYALMLCGSPFTVEEAPAAAELVPSQISMPSSLVIATSKLSVLPNPVTPSMVPDHIMVAASDSVSAFEIIPEPHYISVDTLEPCHIPAAMLEPHYVSSDLPEPRLVSADLRDPRLVSVDLPEPLHVLSTIPESRPMAVGFPEPCSVLSGEAILKRQRLASSVEDPPLVSIRTVGIPKPTHISPVLYASSCSIVPIPEPVHNMAATSKTVYNMAAMSDSPIKMADLREPRHVTADLREPRHVTADLREPRHVTADLREPRHFSAIKTVSTDNAFKLIKKGATLLAGLAAL
ncbi:hypothetical protein DPX16_21229 [Anabarilius grahami]|uniref:Retrotransposon gag domain-containing protein n=1 Tax=Anabarilius grahami TaxID=495550 RepID=A0A3N0XIV7_ANAGA|nr:hypothetical protein DPX16_21229 [Anabarilius grahami]